MNRPWQSSLVRCTVLLVGGAVAVVSVNQQKTSEPVGQIRPSPYYFAEDIQYFPPGPEFRLQREAAAMKAYKSDLEVQRLAEQTP